MSDVIRSLCLHFDSLCTGRYSSQVHVERIGPSLGSTRISKGLMKVLDSLLLLQQTTLLEDKRKTSCRTSSKMNHVAERPTHFQSSDTVDLDLNLLHRLSSATLFAGVTANLTRDTTQQQPTHELSLLSQDRRLRLSDLKHCTFSTRATWREPMQTLEDTGRRISTVSQLRTMRGTFQPLAAAKPFRKTEPQEELRRGRMWTNKNLKSRTI